MDYNKKIKFIKDEQIDLDIQVTIFRYFWKNTFKDSDYDEIMIHLKNVWIGKRKYLCCPLAAKCRN